MSYPSSNNEGDDAWLMKIDLKREEPGEINKDDRIKKAMEVQAPVVKEEDIPQPLPNLFNPTEIEAFKMIELACIQNKYLTHENILLKDHIIALKGIIRNGGAFTLDVRLSTVIITTFITKGKLIIRYGHTPWLVPSLGEVPWYRITITLLSYRFSYFDPFGYILI